MVTSFNLEGPPRPEDMDTVLGDIIYAGRMRDAANLAETMVQWWLASGRGRRDEYDRRHATEQFYFWLGIRSATTAKANADDNAKANRKHERVLARYERTVKVSRQAIPLVHESDCICDACWGRK